MKRPTDAQLSIAMQLQVFKKAPTDAQLFGRKKRTSVLADPGAMRDCTTCDRVYMVDPDHHEREPEMCLDCWLEFRELERHRT